MKIAVLFGGISPERNVSISGGRAVVKALQSKGYEVVPVDPAFGANGIITKEEMISAENYPSIEELSSYSTRNLIDCVNSPIFDDIDCAFLVLHGNNGEDGLVQALLELRGIPYTGSKVKASALGMDKQTSKMLFMAAGIPTPQWVPVRKDDYDNFDYFDEIRDELGNHLVIKPNDQGSSIGVSFVENGNLDDIHNGVLLASKYSDTVIVEKYIPGREITVSIVGSDALPIIEIKPNEGAYDYTNKYTKGKTNYICPAELDEYHAEFIQNQALSAFRILGCSGFARADFRLDEDGQAYILEMNTIPGFTATSLVPMAAKEVGVEFAELCEIIINIALGIEPEEENNEE